MILKSREVAGRSRRGAQIVLFGISISLLGLFIILGLALGPYPLSLREVGMILFQPTSSASESIGHSIVWDIRLPRILLAVFVGCGLSVAGACLQGVFRNPLADPALIGISSGAALAAGVCLVFLVPVGLASGPWQTGILPFGAFLGGLATTLIVYRLARCDGRIDIATMLLAGIALNALAGAGTGLITYLATDEQLRSFTFWTLGSLAGANWLSAGVTGFFTVGAVWVLWCQSRCLNALLLGEAEAGHLGFHVARTQRTVIIGSALTVGATVAFCGIIGFLGLVVPHIIRLAAGPDHRVLIPLSALFGAALLLAADLAARSMAAPAEVPIGILTALVGAPFFLWLLLRERGQRFSS